MKLDHRYADKVYGGFMGKVVGVIHGANIEGWPYEKIKNVFGRIEGYPYTFRNFCADDDINGPVFFMRALADYGMGRATSVKQMADTLMNYVADGHGFFWWGGYGVSTEHTAYENLMRGSGAPLSGSAALNGKAVSEQIGGQIFSDCWGLVCPGDPALAAGLAEKMSSVTHDGEGINGGRFVAAAVASAFTAENMEEVLDTALAQIPADSMYARMAGDVISVCRENGDDWEKSFRYVKEKYGYQHYPGVCHIIPNAAVIMLSLVHGEGGFDRTVNICNMCGWDTDCNVGNVGAVMGALHGIEGIGKQWLSQVNDFFCASSVVGSLNIQTVSQAAVKAMQITAGMYGAEPEGIWAELAKEQEGARFHFEFPTATHAMRARGTEGSRIFLQNSGECAHTGSRSLKLVAPVLKNGEQVVLYHKTYYVPGDFDDSRYNPDFSPTIYPGDAVSAWIRPGVGLAPVTAVPYYRDRISGACIRIPESAALLSAGEWGQVRFAIPPVRNTLVEEIGFVLTGLPAEGPHERTLYLDDLTIRRRPDYAMDFACLPDEKWNAFHQEPAHITHLRGIVELADGVLCVSSAGPAGEAYTGHFAWRDYELEASLRPLLGETHRVFFRVQGGMRSYAVSLRSGGIVSLDKKEDGIFRPLCKAPFAWKHGEEYTLRVHAAGSVIAVAFQGEELLRYEDGDRPYLEGGIGFGNEGISRTAFRHYAVRSARESL